VFERVGPDEPIKTTVTVTDWFGLITSTQRITITVF